MSLSPMTGPRPAQPGHPRTAARSMFDPALVRPAIADSFRKLTPRTQFRNPVMFCVRRQHPDDDPVDRRAVRPYRSGRRFHRRDRAVVVVHRAVRELRRSARGRAFEGAGRPLRSAKHNVVAKASAPREGGRRSDGVDRPAQGRRRARRNRRHDPGRRRRDRRRRVGRRMAITGESAPVIREAGGDSSVTGGTRVLSDWIVVRVAVNPGEAFSTG